MPRNLFGRRAAVAFGLLASSSLFVGCGDATVERGEPVTGTVTLDGQPLAQGAVHVIRISSVEGGAGDPNIMPGETRPAKERVPPAWNSKSKHEVEVVDGDNTFSFDVKTSG